MTTSKQADECSVFNCSDIIRTHSNCGKKVPDFQEVLQLHSINSLIAKGVLSNDEDRYNGINDGNQESLRDVQIKQELLGLNSPRGLLPGGFGSDGEYPTSPMTTSTPFGFEFYEEPNYALAPTSSSANGRANHREDIKQTPLNNVNRNASFSDSSSSSGKSMHPWRSPSSSLSDNSGSNSPSVYDSYYNGNQFNYGADYDNSAVSSPDGSRTEILNALTMWDSIVRGRFNEIDLNKVELLKHRANSTCNNTLQTWTDNLFSSARSQGSSSNWGSLNNSLNCCYDNAQLDRAARFHRTAASIHDATCTWSGILPERRNKPLGFSTKVFLGGVPWDISEQLLVQTFKQFGPIRVEWPGKEKQATQPKGYVYIIFESEKEVRSLLAACSTNFKQPNCWFYKMSSKRMRAKDVQVIPWFLNDSNFSKSTYQKLDPSRTVFVGALHGMLNADGLARIMNDLFDGVVYAGIDTDKYKYPMGSGRVTFNNSKSYMKAVAAAFIEIRTAKFTKKVQVDPYLEDSLCSICGVQQGPYFCRELTCFRYFCRGCWMSQHCMAFRTHKPLMRNSKNSAILGLNSHNDCHIVARCD